MKQMLRDMGLTDEGRRIEEAVKKTIKEGKHVTRDLGGRASTSDYTKSIIDKL